MAILNFPDTSGQLTDGSFTYTENNITYVWNGTYWAATNNVGDLDDRYLQNTGPDTFTGDLTVTGNLDLGVAQGSDTTDVVTGSTYIITANSDPASPGQFTALGAPDGNIGTVFVATGTGTLSGGNTVATAASDGDLTSAGHGSFDDGINVNNNFSVVPDGTTYIGTRLGVGTQSPETNVHVEGVGDSSAQVRLVQYQPNQFSMDGPDLRFYARLGTGPDNYDELVDGQVAGKINHIIHHPTVADPSVYTDAQWAGMGCTYFRDESDPLNPRRGLKFRLDTHTVFDGDTNFTNRITFDEEGKCGLGTEEPMRFVEICHSYDPITAEGTEQLRPQLVISPDVGDSVMEGAFTGIGFVPAAPSSVHRSLVAASLYYLGRKTGNYGLDGHLGIAVTDISTDATDRNAITEGELEEFTKFILNVEGRIGLGGNLRPSGTGLTVGKAQGEDFNTFYADTAGRTYICTDFGMGTFDWSTVTDDEVLAINDEFTVREDVAFPIAITDGAFFASPPIPYNSLFEGSRLCQRKISSIHNDVFKGFHVYKPSNVTAGSLDSSVHAFSVASGFADSLGTYRVGYECQMNQDTGTLTSVFSTYMGGNAPAYFGGLIRTGQPRNPGGAAGDGNPTPINDEQIWRWNVQNDTCNAVRISSRYVQVANYNTDADSSNIGLNRLGSTTGRFILFAQDGAIVDDIALDGLGGVSFGGTSDYRLKENISDITTSTAVEQLKALRPVTFNFKNAPGKTRPGFIAHEVAEILPEAVTGNKDETCPVGTLTDALGNILETDVPEPLPADLVYEQQVEATPYVAHVPAVYGDDGLIETPEVLEQEPTYTTVTAQKVWTETGTRDCYQKIDYNKLIPILTKALQEALERIEALENA